jgi:membrane protein YqaA with SNARE-associated domain
VPVSPEAALLLFCTALVVIGALAGGLFGYMLGVGAGWRRCEKDRHAREQAELEALSAPPGFEPHVIEGG